MPYHRPLTALLFAGLALSAPLSQAEGLKFLPILQSDFKAEPSLAVTVGAVHAPSARDDVIGSYGLDFNMNCGLIQTPDNRIRTHVQLNHVDQSGVRATSLELSPRYTLPLGGGFSFGAGPALAWVSAKTAAGDKDLFGYGVASGFNFRKGHYYSGLDLRYLNTEARQHVEFENWALTAKVGFNF